MKNTQPTWHKIESRLKETLPQKKVTSIKVIQNIFLWKKFQLEFDRLNRKHGKVPIVH